MADLPPTLIDIRLVERNLRSGRLTKEAYEAHLASLPDVASSGQMSDLRFRAGDSGTRTRGAAAPAEDPNED